MTGDRPNTECLHGGDRGGSAIERRELDFERLPIRIDVNHRPDIAHFEALSRYGLGQNDSIMLLNHFERVTPWQDTRSRAAAHSRRDR
jgi:hypothetical protein